MLKADQTYCRILQYLRPSLNCRLSLRPLFCLFLSGSFTQVLLYFRPLTTDNLRACQCCRTNSIFKRTQSFSPVEEGKSCPCREFKRGKYVVIALFAKISEYTVPMNSIFCVGKLNLGWSIVYIRWSGLNFPIKMYFSFW